MQGIKKFAALFMLVFVLAFIGCAADEPIVTYQPDEAIIVEGVYEPLIYEPPKDEVSIEDEPTFDFIEYWLSQMTLEEKIGQLFVLRLPWQATAITTQTEQLLTDIPVGGIILFGDNVQSIAQMQALTAQLQTMSPLPMFIAIDEEGGRVSRIGRLFGEPTPAAYEIGATNDTAYAREVGQDIGQRLTTLGINMNFAPIADVWSNPSNAVIGNRAFGRTADVASPMVAATVYGLHDEGIFAVVKHFPGHGDTYEDSHYMLAIHPHGLERFYQVEVLPFISGIEAGADGVMIAHISTPEIAYHNGLLPWMEPWIESGLLPATFSDFWLQDILRDTLGFDGLIITDALEMRALTDHFTCGQIALGAFLAGADILLMPSNPREAFQALLQGYEEGLFTEERLDQSLRRILTAKETIQ
ncbi:MAG: glycoside hydrolase family 3 protein [Defluviitaleaceae bacterium]|nr:glycoside hydrolase family 3 protein [Defluviitaleaceae bacterium]